MMKDYKRLHHLDFWEPDLDDSDGGYSDFLPGSSATAASAAAADAGSQPQDANPAGDTSGVSAAVPTEADTANKGKELLNGECGPSSGPKPRLRNKAVVESNFGVQSHHVDHFKDVSSR